MAKKKNGKPSPKPAKPKKEQQPPPWQEVMLRRVAKLKSLDAVFYGYDSGGICHVFWIVKEHHDAPYKEALKQEKEITTEYPNVPFYFHFRARQGRDPARTAPRGLEPLYIRHE